MIGVHLAFLATKSLFELRNILMFACFLSFKYIQGLYKCERTKGGTQAERHRHTQRLLCKQLNASRAGRSCDLAVGKGSSYTPRWVDIYWALLMRHILFFMLHFFQLSLSVIYFLTFCLCLSPYLLFSLAVALPFLSMLCLGLGALSNYMGRAAGAGRDFPDTLHSLFFLSNLYSSFHWKDNQPNNHQTNK